MIYIVDIDNTICTQKYNGEYHKAVPYKDRIDIINKLYDKGHEIIYWTGRGSASKVDYYDLTLNQLKEWGVKFTELRMSKPCYDVWIDDKASWF